MRDKNEMRLERKFINKIVLSHLKQNRWRNLCIMLGIILSFILFISLFSIISAGVQAIFDQQAIRNSYDYHGRISGFRSETDIKRVEENFLVSTSSRVISGLDIKYEDTGMPLEFIGTDSEFAAHSYLKFSQGKMPEHENEIAVNENVWKGLGYENIKTGDVLTLRITSFQTQTSRNLEVRVTGIFSTVCPMFAKSNVVSLKLADKYCGIESDFTSLYINFKIPILTESQFDFILKDTELYYEINSAYQISNFKVNQFEFIVYGIFAILILINGYFLIYNIFYFEISQDVRTYGILKVSGMTERQLKKMIWKEIHILYIFSAIIGITAGYFIGGNWIGNLYYQRTGILSTYHINMIPFLFSIIFSYVTVHLAVSKPISIVRRLEPVEAVKYIGNDNDTKMWNGNRNKLKLAFPYMAIQNLKRNWKRTGMMVVSMTLSIIIVNAVYTMFGNLDYSISVTYTLNNKDDFGVIDKKASSSNEFFSEKYPGISAEVIKTITNMKGVKEIHPVYYIHMDKPVSEIEKAGIERVAKRNQTMSNQGAGDISIPINIFGIDQVWYDNLTKITTNILEGKFDQKKFESGEYVILTAPAYPIIDSSTGGLKDHKFNYYHVGDTVGFGAEKQYKIMMILSSTGMAGVRPPLSFDFGYHAALPVQEALTLYKKISKKPEILRLGISANENELIALGDSLTESKESLGIDIIERTEIIKSSMRLLEPLKITGMFLCSLLAAVGMFSFCNMLFSDLISRRRELSLMECIGMTRTQKRELILWEDTFYIIMITGFSLLFGIPLTQLATTLLSQQMQILNTRQSFAMLLWIPVLFIVSFAITEIFIIIDGKKSTIEKVIT